MGETAGVRPGGRGLPLDQELLKFILEQLKDTARECSDLRAAERLRMLAAEVERRAARNS